MAVLNCVSGVTPAVHPQLLPPPGIERNRHPAAKRVSR
ncbi:hypothetical protein A225_3557 [Klebsiella michiganensis E718]|nr:hypothetical protein A225_3557 [Klebsiella michiganensis E718]